MREEYHRPTQKTPHPSSRHAYRQKHSVCVLRVKRGRGSRCVSCVRLLCTALSFSQIEPRASPIRYNTLFAAYVPYTVILRGGLHLSLSLSLSGEGGGERCGTHRITRFSIYTYYMYILCTLILGTPGVVSGGVPTLSSVSYRSLDSFGRDMHGSRLETTHYIWCVHNTHEWHSLSVTSPSQGGGKKVAPT